MQTVAPLTHAHPSDLEVCVDLINTSELTAGVPEEHLPTADMAITFLAEHHLGHEGDLRAQARRDGDAWLARVHHARAALRDVWDAQVDGREPAAAAISTVNDLLARAPRLELRPRPAGVEVGHRHDEDDPTGESLARAAQPLVDAIASGQTDRFRVCANDGCRWVFEDVSRGGRRRWCDMATCGNRAKVRRFRTRQREEPDAPLA